MTNDTERTCAAPPARRWHNLSAVMTFNLHTESRQPAVAAVYAEMKLHNSHSGHSEVCDGRQAHGGTQREKF